MQTTRDSAVIWNYALDDGHGAAKLVGGTRFDLEVNEGQDEEGPFISIECQQFVQGLAMQSMHVDVQLMLTPGGRKIPASGGLHFLISVNGRLNSDKKSSAEVE